MAKKKVAKKTTVSKNKQSKLGLAVAGAKAVGGLMGIGGKGKGKGGKRSRKKSAYWYAKEIQRLKLKRRYNKIKLGGM